MADIMTFPDTVEEFMEQYKIVDTDQVYTNGMEFVPIFRMEQWFEHCISPVPATDVAEVVRCKDCVSCVPKYMDFTGEPYWICHNWVAQVDADGFCYEGKRREDAEIY